MTFRRHLIPMIAAWTAFGLLTTGCAAKRPDLERPRRTARNARWKRATFNALKDRGTWIPAAGAAVVSIDDWDQEISEWARRETPVFGSTQDASEYSDRLRTSTGLVMVGTSVAFTGTQDDWEYGYGRVLIGMTGVAVGNVTAYALKDQAGRLRPNGSSRNSFPSGHATQAFSQAGFACRNVDTMPNLSRSQRWGLKSTFRTLAAGTAWARVEAGAHYPSDVLFGAALGNFVSILFHDALLPADVEHRWNVEIDLDRVALSYSFSRPGRGHGFTTAR